MVRFIPAVVLAVVLGPTIPAADWKGKPDPAPRDRTDWPAEPVLDVSIPRWGFTTTVAFADQGGPFVALAGGGGTDGTLKVFDLRTGKSVSELPGEFRIQKPLALSPDGKHLAGVSHGIRGTTAAVIDLKAGKVAQEFPAGRTNVDWFAFAGPERLIVSSYDSEAAVAVYQLKTGKRLRTLPVGRHGVRAISPGGTYMAVGTDSGARMLHLETGDEVGDLRMIDAGPGQRCEGLAFSPDGKQLAALFGFSDHRVGVWSLEDGKLVRTVTLVKGSRVGPDNKLDWSADGSAWLAFQELVIDPETGKTLWKAPTPRGFDQTRRLASAHAVIVWEPSNKTEQSYRLHALTRPKAEVAAVRDALRAGGSALDAVLPAAREVDLTAAKVVEVPLAGVEWKARPDPAGETARVARQPVPLLFRADQVVSAYIGRGERPAAVFELTDAATPRPGGDPAADGQARRVERVDLYTGRVTGRVSLPAGLRVLGAGPDTEMILTTDPGKVRMDVWSAADGKHVAGWRPYAKDREPERAVAFAAALGSDRVLTVSAVGKVVLWSVPDLKPAYLAEVPGLTVPTLTPGGKYLVGWQRTAFRLLDTQTGEPVGDLIPGFPVRGGSDSPRTVAVRPDGAEAAAVVGQINGPPQLVRWDLQTGKETAKAPYGSASSPRPVSARRPEVPPGFPPPGYQPGFPPPGFPPPGFPQPGMPSLPIDYSSSPTPPSRMGYAGGDYLLLEGRDLYSLKQNGVVWSYSLSPAGDGQVLGQWPDGRVWYVAGSGAEAALVAVELPAPEVQEKIKTATEGPAALLKPGVKVEVKLDFTGTGAEAMQPKVLAELKRAWQGRGLSVVEKSGDLTVKLTVAQKETDRVQEMFPPFRPGDAGPGRRGLKLIELHCGVQIATPDGKTVWEARPETLPMRNPFEAGLQGVAVEEAEKRLHQRTWEVVPLWAVRSALPRFLAVDANGNAITLPGRSSLTASGVVPATNPE